MHGPFQGIHQNPAYMRFAMPMRGIDQPQEYPGPGLDDAAAHTAEPAGVRRQRADAVATSDVRCRRCCGSLPETVVEERWRAT
ncbi:hypothetical protein CC86DRAFT_423645 [Ophiobolus disseminans]|uniref:Uncharacterized protein n=1 Tax=Ophiobolus disseminans TaxID=1469910 RepID=A0A6A6ZN06_9PLEO|nr:hypothetical protein CC86DRAFT_423645 [Ophiobolus disseminans]